MEMTEQGFSYQTELYFSWLCGIVGADTVDNLHHGTLAVLFDQNFVWDPRFVGDENRAEDGTELRDQFCDDVIHNWDDTRFLFGPCTVLEMLIALAWRMAFETDEVDGTDAGTSAWFWVLMMNLDLIRERPAAEIVDVVNILLTRSYGRNGRGGLFPLNSPRGDCRKMEIWDQMHAYIQENYTP